jgi:membrane protein implicated in regulation of membrane protease activity
MINLVTGLIGIALVVVFLGNYAVALFSIPLWIIIVAVLAMAIADFVQSVRASRGRESDLARAGDQLAERGTEPPRG